MHDHSGPSIFLLPFFGHIRAPCSKCVSAMNSRFHQSFHRQGVTAHGVEHHRVLGVFPTDLGSISARFFVGCLGVMPWGSRKNGLREQVLTPKRIRVKDPICLRSNLSMPNLPGWSRRGSKSHNMKNNNTTPPLRDISPEELVTGRAMATMLSLSPKSLTRYRAAKMIPFYRLGQKCIRYNPTRVFQALEGLHVNHM